MISLYGAILAAAAQLIPREERIEWRAEWSAELWYLRHSESPPCGPMRFCLGAFRDATLLRLNRPVPRFAPLRSPVVSLSMLAALAGAGLLLSMRSAAAWQLVERQPLPLHALMLVLALLILPAAANLSVPAQPVRGWLLLAAKLALITPAVFFGVFTIAPFIGAVQPHVMLVGYILAFRWALNDQRKRCPECLRLCGNPVRIGHPSYVLLGWYGTELMCPEGHGLIQLPQLPKASFSPHRWLRVDVSLRSLFSQGSLDDGGA